MLPDLEEDLGAFGVQVAGLPGDFLVEAELQAVATPAGEDTLHPDTQAVGDTILGTTEGAAALGDLDLVWAEGYSLATLWGG